LKFEINSKKIYKGKKSNVFRVRFSGISNVYRLYKFMYKNSDGLFLSRKKQRFDEFFKTYNWKTI
jgi:hypothetical protein